MPIQNLDPALAAQLQTYYEGSGLTQEKLAQKIGVSYSWLSLFLNSGKAGFKNRNKVVAFLAKKSK